MPGYYDGWETEPLTCPECEWKGAGAECVQGELFDELFEIDCPNCSRRLTVITYPTIEESRANWDKVSDADKRMIEGREQFIKETESRCLESPEQLPDIPGDNLVFLWDQQNDDTVISYGKEIIWREPAFYEGYTRFEEVVIILKRKYGMRLKDVIPVLRSQNYLLGDCLSAWNTVQSIRSCLELSDWQHLPTRILGRHLEIDWRKVVIEKPGIKK